MDMVIRKSPQQQLSMSTVALFLAGLLWIISLGLPVFKTPAGTIMGYWVFVTGWMGLAIFQFAWYANLMLLAGVLTMYTRPISSAIISGLGMLLATQAFWFDVIPASSSSTPILGQEVGFWCWYISLLLLGFGVFAGADNQTPAEEHIHTATPTPAMPATPEPAKVRAYSATESDDVCFFTGCKTSPAAKQA